MKSRRQRATVLQSEVHPVLFDHDLLRHLYVSGDGVDVIDLTNSSETPEGKREMEEKLFLHYYSKEYMGKHAANPAFVYLHDAKSPSGTVLRQIENQEPHIWLIQQDENTVQKPQGYSFSSPANLFAFLRERKLRPPGYQKRSKSSFGGGRSPPLMGEPLPQAKWIDIQTSGDISLLRGVLARFRVDSDTEDRCLYLLGQDHIDTKYSTFGGQENGTGYFFLSLVCTPVVTAETMSLWSSEKSAPPSSSFFQPPSAPSFSAGREGVNPDTICRGKSVMEMRFHALRDRTRARKSTVPDSVPVGVIAFRDWIITVHEGPFAEMDDLLRMLQLYCGQVADPIQHFTYWSVESSQRFTTPLFVGSLLRIAVGHNINSVALAEVVNELEELVFDVPEEDTDEESVISRITNTRRCFGECTTDVNRRQKIVNTLLDAEIANNFFPQDQGCKEVLETLRSHLGYVQDELADCRDTVAVSHWYHNVASQRTMVIRANRDQRVILLLTELCNVMYSIMLFQTLYSMNVIVPFDSNGNDPNTSYIPFIVTAIFFLAYFLWFSGKALQIFRRQVYHSKFFGS